MLYVKVKRVNPKSSYYHKEKISFSISLNLCLYEIIGVH